MSHMSEDLYDNNVIAPEPKPEPAPKPRRRTTRRRSSAGGAKARVEAILKGIELSRQLDSERTSIVASALGVDADTDLVAAHLAAGSKVDVAPFEAIVELRELGSDMAAGIRAHELTEDRKGFTKLWELVAGRTELAAEPPKASTEAALALATAVRDMTDTDVATILEVKDFLD